MGGATSIARSACANTRAHSRAKRERAAAERDAAVLVQGLLEEQRPAPRSPVKSPVAAKVPAIDVSQRFMYENGLEVTPKSAAKQEFRYYCPICMKYFQAVFESQCCGNYLCHGCALEFVARHESNRARTRAESRGGGVGESLTIRCPSCNVPELCLAHVARDAPVRSYDDDDGVQPAILLDSPVRVGDSYDALRRKMLAFNETGSTRQNVRKLFDDDDDNILRSSSSSSASSSSSSNNNAHDRDDDASTTHHATRGDVDAVLVEHRQDHPPHSEQASAVRGGSPVRSASLGTPRCEFARVFIRGVLHA